MNAMNPKRTYGYIRVSTKEQNEARQVAAFEQSEMSIDRVFVDRQSGKDFERPGYKRMMRNVKQGDLIIIKSIDRLGRNYDEILEQWRQITKVKQADILVLDMPLLDTRTGNGLIGQFISDIVLQLLAFVAQQEREFIKQRQAEGIAAAKKKRCPFR